MSNEKINAICHTVIDMMVIVSVVVLMVVDKIDKEWGIGIILLVAGLWKQSQSNGGNKMPPTGLAVSLGIPVLTAFGKIRNLLVLFFILVSGCASNPYLHSIKTHIDDVVEKTSSTKKYVVQLCSDLEWEAVDKHQHYALAESEISKIRAECNRIYIKYEQWVTAYWELSMAIDSDDVTRIYQAVIRAASASNEFVKTVHESIVLNEGENGIH